MNYFYSHSAPYSAWWPGIRLKFSGEIMRLNPSRQKKLDELERRLLAHDVTKTRLESIKHRNEREQADLNHHQRMVVHFNQKINELLRG